MPSIVLATLNARYVHASFGLRYLQANLGHLQGDSVIREFTLTDHLATIVERILGDEPSIVGFGVYVWNVARTTEVVAMLRALRPDIRVVLGGPEVSHELDAQPIVAMADHVVCGEGEVAFRELATVLLEGGEAPAALRGADQRLSDLVLPYALYTDADIAHRVLYVEASRGCPFRCAFCLSALPGAVRKADHRFLAALDTLLDRGATRFKFVDRTFNLDISASTRILDFFEERLRKGMHLHFEMIPDRLPDALRTALQRFPPAAIQLEVGLQTLNPEVAARIDRRQDLTKAENNLRFLMEHTGVHVHADLIMGLPGETLESFADGFDRLLSWGPQEIQVGLLKRLRGTPIVRHTDTHGMVYRSSAPYDVLQTDAIGFQQMQRLRRFAHVWDRVNNRGHFVQTVPRLFGQSASRGMLAFSDWVFTTTGQSVSIAKSRWAKLLFTWLTVHMEQEAAGVAADLCADLRRTGDVHIPRYLKSHDCDAPGAATRPDLPRRQARHAAKKRERDQ
jgi:radical SAM superfamily enzyme YgiQ (UPF0313 family)